MAQRGRYVIASILIIDDDPQVLGFLRHVLQEAGHIVLPASNGREGLRLFQMTSPAVVVTDLLMPDLDGLEVILTLHQASPATRIIAFTGRWVDWDYLDVAKIFGAHQTFRKPISPTELLDAVRQELAASMAWKYEHHEENPHDSATSG